MVDDGSIVDRVFVSRQRQNRWIFLSLPKKKKELELRIETQKQTLQSRDESIKKLLEMLQNKGLGECVVDQVRPSIALRRYRLR